jgi:hypothetical protein
VFSQETSSDEDHSLFANKIQQALGIFARRTRLLNPPKSIVSFCSASAELSFLLTQAYDAPHVACKLHLPVVSFATSQYFQTGQGAFTIFETIGWDM